MPAMTPAEFVAKWRSSTLKERSSAQPHFIDLCKLLNLPDPPTADPTGDHYTFERHVTKVTGGKGFADVWKNGSFAWEYKGKKKNLTDAYLQLLIYRDDLQNPPLLVVSDIETIEVHTNFTGTNKVVTKWALEDLLDDTKREKLRRVWTEPNSFDPTRERISITESTVKQFLNIADALKERQHDPDKTAHFLVKCVFTLFAEDMKLLPKNGFTQLLEAASEDPKLFKPMAQQLFDLMSQGGVSILGRVPHFNGQVFSDGEAPDLNLREVNYLLTAARQDWQNVNPAIFGTLFERIIDPRKRAQIGAHYTPPTDILDVIEPVIFEPLRQEWQAVRSELEPLIKQAQPEENETNALMFQSETPLWQHARAEAKAKLEVFQNRLANVTVLDPACGSGNFLYMTLRLLLDLENEVRATIRLLEPGLRVPVKVSPRQMKGMELNRYAHEIAGIVLWIGFIQWCAEHNEPIHQEPILEKLLGLENKDAALDEATGKPTVWGDAEFIVGNPPFLGDKKMRQELGGDYVEALRKAYDKRVSGQSDLVCYWFEQARVQIAMGKTRRVGLIATNSIRQGANRTVLEAILATGGIFSAWTDREWTQDGAAVRVSVICFDNGTEIHRTQNGQEVSVINADLSSSTNLTSAKPLLENTGLSFIGIQRGGDFDIPNDIARAWLELPNPSGVVNSNVLHPYITGQDITQKPSGRWIIDFAQMTESEAAQYVVPFAHVVERVKPMRVGLRRANHARLWWQFQEQRPGLRKKIKDLGRFLATSRVSKHRIFAWIPETTVVESRAAIIARNDDFMFAMLHSRLHWIWALKMGSTLEDRPLYTPSSCFETFPFPHPTNPQRENISKAAVYLEACRTHLKSKGKTLTEAYNALEECRKKPNPTHEAYSLMLAHETLDKTVFAAYGWDYPLSEDEILERLLSLNLERAAAQGENTVSSVESEETEASNT